MKKKLCVISLVVVVVLLLSALIGWLVACSRTSSKDVTDQMDLVPQKANLIGHVQLSELTGGGDIAEIYATLPKDAGDPQTIEEALEKGMNMSDLDLTRFEEAWIFSDISQISENNTYAAAILKGTFEEKSLVDSMRSATGQGFSSIAYQGHTIYTESDQQIGLVILSSDMLVTGSLPAVKDVIAVREGNMPATSGELLSTYRALDDSMIKMAAEVPPGLLEQEIDELTTGISSPPALDSLSDMQIASMTLSKDGESIACNSQFFFSDKESANDVKGLIPLLSLVVGGVDTPGGSVIQHPENTLTLLPLALAKSDFSTSGRCLTVTTNVTAADIEAMSTPSAPSGLAIATAVHIGDLTSSGLDISVDVLVSNNLALNLEIGDLLLNATADGQTIIAETMAGGSIAANATTRFQHNTVIPLDLLGERDLQVTVDTTAKARGLSMPLSAAITLTTPDVDSLIVIPEIDLVVDPGDLTSDGLPMGLQVNLSNPNPFAVDVGELQIEATGQSGNVITKAILAGANGGLSIAPNSTGTLSGDLLIPPAVIDEPVVVMTARTQGGFAGVTLPIKGKVTVNMPDIESLITIPEIEMGVDFGELSSDGLPMGLQVNLSNPNPFAVDVGELQIEATGQAGAVLTNAILAGADGGISIAPNSTGTLSGDLLIPAEVINEPVVVITVQTQGGFAGVTLPISARVTVNMPDAQSLITAPGIDMRVGFGELSSDGLPMGLQVNLSNPNPFAIDVGDVQVVASGQSGNVIFSSHMDGISVGPDSNGTLSGDFLMPLDVLKEPTIAVTIQTQAGFASLSLPISARITVNMPEIESLIAAPGIEIGVDLGDISSDGLDVGLQLTITNSNPFAIDMGNVQIVAKGQSGNVISTSHIDGRSITPYSTGTLSGNLLMPLDVLNESSVVITAHTQAGFAGVNLPVTAKVTVAMPDIESLVTMPEIEMYTSASWIADFPLPQLRVAVASTITNRGTIDLNIDDVQVTFFDSSNDCVGHMTMPGGTIKARSSVKFSGSTALSASEYISLLGGGHFTVRIATQAGISGVHLTLPVEAAMTIDMSSLIELPTFDIGVDCWELTADGLHLKLHSNIYNSNAFPIDVGDLQIVVEDESGNVILTSDLKGLSIGPNSNGTLSCDLTLPLDVLNERVIVVSVRSQAGFSGLTQPINGRFTINLPDIRSLLMVPETDFAVDFGTLTADGLRLTLRSDVSNSNPFGIDIGDLQITAKDDSGNVILTSTVTGVSVAPNSSSTLVGDLLIPSSVLNSSTVVIEVQTQAGFAAVALPVNGKVTVKMPDASGLVATPEMDLGVDLWDLTSDGLYATLRVDMSNPNPFGVDVGELQIVAKGQSGNVILTANMNGLSIGPNSSGTVSGDLLIPQDAIDEPTVVITVQTRAGSGGITVPLKGKIAVEMPGAASLVAVPEIDLGVVLSDLTSDGLYVALQAELTNSNPFGIDVGELQIVGEDQSGNAIVTANMNGLSMGPNSSSTLSGDLLMPVGAINGSTVVITVQTQAEFAPIVLPVKAKIALQMPEIERLVSAPEMDLGVVLGELAADGLHMGLQVNITNPNAFGVDVGELQIVAKGQSGNVILTTSANGLSIGAGSAGTLSVDLVIPTEAISEPTITITVDTQAACNTVTLPVNAKVVLVNMPTPGSSTDG